MGRKSLAKSLLGIRPSIHLYIAIGKHQIAISGWGGGGGQSRSQRLHSGKAISFLRLSRSDFPRRILWAGRMQTRQTDKDRKSETCRPHYFGSVTRRTSFARRFCVIAWSRPEGQ